MPTYGIPGLFTDVNDNRAHGKDERLSVKSYYWGAEFFHRFTQALAR
jgi:acetylornithine deacetylase/succinyl-diaminopimelate desuccinylase-like protein